jgi:glucose-specific phosphotransferase system IIA component
MLILTAPLDGWCLPLAEVPDPVFARGLAGDGLAIDPTGTVLRAPCDGELLPVQSAAHALRIRAASGVEVLLHLGIDTVALKGEGFTALARAGDAVRAGQELLRFDLDLIARRAKSAVTPVLLAGAATIRRRREPGPVAAGDFLMELADGASELRVIEGRQRGERAAFVPRAVRARDCICGPRR